MLVTARDDPLLAQWQYGLGRSVAWTSDSTGRWAKSWIGWDGFSQFFSQMVGWTFPGEESGGIEATFVDRGGRTYLRVESVDDGRLAARLLLDPAWRSSGPTWQPATSTCPGRAGRVRGAGRRARQRRVRGPRDADQARARRRSGGRSGSSRRRRPSTGCSGANEPLLAAIRNATGGEALDAPAEAWVHDLQATSRYTDLWPLLLVLALLLWPLDIALRRVSLGRRELADGRRWVGDRVGGRRVARRTAQTDDLFAARERAGSAGRARRDRAPGIGNRRRRRRRPSSRSRPRPWRRRSPPHPSSRRPSPRRRPRPRPRRPSSRRPHAAAARRLRPRRRPGHAAARRAARASRTRSRASARRSAAPAADQPDGASRGRRC